MAKVHIGVIGDFDPANPNHLATNEAIRHSLGDPAATAGVEWLETSRVHDLSRFHGFWCSPGSPYRDMDRALEAIRFARVNGVPFIGTCGGCQHAVLEFARNIMHIEDAQHAEYDPYASVLFIERLSCSLVGKVMPVNLKAGSLAASLYGQARVDERYYCNFGLNPKYNAEMEAAGMRISGRDDQGEVRIVELPNHPFFVATLFVPQAISSPAHPHPLIAAFCSASLNAAHPRSSRLSEANYTQV